LLLAISARACEDNYKASNEIELLECPSPYVNAWRCYYSVNRRVIGVFH
jgi:hypothetical protein